MKNNVPLLNVLDNIEKSWTKEQLKSFAEKPDSIAINDAYFGYGLYFRNTELRNSNDSTLIKYFYSLGVYNEDYMSGIVLGCLHSKLNNKPINLEKRISKLRDIISKQENLDKKNTIRALKYYNKFNIGDTVIVRMPISRNNNATQYSNPEDSKWVHNDSLDLLIKGIIKSKVKDSIDMSFKLKVLSMNRENVKVLMRSVKVGDIIKSDFSFDIITAVR